MDNQTTGPGGRIVLEGQLEELVDGQMVAKVNGTGGKLKEESFLATRRGKFTLLLLCSVAFLDFIDGVIVNVALPSIRRDLSFSLQSLQWVLSGYLLTYGGFMLLGGRAADLLGRRRVLVTGTSLFALSSFVGGLSNDAAQLVASRIVQGAGAAMMLPAALSLLTTMFRTQSDRHTALGAWGGTAGLASAAGALLGGLLTEGPGWRWVLFVNPPLCVLVLGAVFLLIPADKPRERGMGFDFPGAVLSTAGMLLLVFAMVKAPEQGWGSTRTVTELAAAVALLIVFVVNEQRSRSALMPLSIFRIKGLAAADVTQLIAIAGFLAMFFFLTLYMQNVLGYSPIKTGLAYLPVCFGVGIAAGIASQLLSKVGTRPIIVSGSLLAAGGVYYLSRMPVHGSYLSDLLPGMVVMSIGLGAVFVAITTAANANVPADKSGLAAALLNASQQVGGALGIAIFSAIATARTNDLLASHHALPNALTAGFQRTLLASSIFLVAAALIGLRTTNTREEAK